MPCRFGNTWNDTPKSVALWISLGTLYLAIAVGSDGTSILSLIDAVLFYLAAWAEWWLDRRKKVDKYNRYRHYD